MSKHYTQIEEETKMKYGWTINDNDTAACTPDGNSTLEVCFAEPHKYNVVIDDNHICDTTNLEDGMRKAEEEYDRTMGFAKQEKRLDEFAMALLHAKVSLQTALSPVDELNGRLEEATNQSYYGPHTSFLSDEAIKTLEDAHKFYVDLPVWDTIENLAERLNDVRLEVNAHRRKKSK
jgi:hypothetical protein